MAEKSNAYRILMGKYERITARHRCVKQENIKRSESHRKRRLRLQTLGSGHKQTADRSLWTAGCIQHGRLADWLRNSDILKKG
jgi:hypothetical protein